MNLATISTPSGGLGFLDSSSSLLEFDLVIPAPAATASGTALVDLKSASDTASVGSSTNKGSGADKRQSKGRAGRDRAAIKVERGTAGHAGSGKGKDKGGVVGKDVVVPVQVQQDLNLLKSSKGDTGEYIHLIPEFCRPAEVLSHELSRAAGGRRPLTTRTARRGVHRITACA